MISRFTTEMISLLEMLRDEEVVLRGNVRAREVEMYEPERWKQVRGREVENIREYNLQKLVI